MAALVVEPARYIEGCAQLAEQAGNSALAASIRTLGAKVVGYSQLSFDEIAALNEVTEQLDAPPFVGELDAALTASVMLSFVGDTETAGYKLLGLFRAKQATRDVTFMQNADFLGQLVECAVAFDKHEAKMGWAFAALPSLERARWACLMAAANDNIGLETTGGWLPLAASCVAEDGELHQLAVSAYATLGMDARYAEAALQRIGRCDPSSTAHKTTSGKELR